MLSHLCINFYFFSFYHTSTTEIYTLSLHDALPILRIKSCKGSIQCPGNPRVPWSTPKAEPAVAPLQSVSHPPWTANPDRKSTRLNSSHMSISYAVFCLKKKILHIVIKYH